MKCAHCNKELTPWSYPIIVKETFCNPECMEAFYLKKIDSLTESVKRWKNAWWEQRDIIGKHGVKIMRIEYPSYFKENLYEKG